MFIMVDRTFAVFSFLALAASASGQLIQCQQTVRTTVGSTLKLTATLQLGRRTIGRHTITMTKIGETDPLGVCLLELTDSAVKPDCGIGKEVSTSVSGSERHLTITRTTDHVRKTDEGTYNVTWTDSENHMRFCITEVKIEEEPPVTVTPRGLTGNDSEKNLEERACKSHTESNVHTALITVLVIAGLEISIAIVYFRREISAKCLKLFQTITGHNNEEASVPPEGDTTGREIDGGIDSSQNAGSANGAPTLPGDEGEPMIRNGENDFVMVDMHGEEAKGEQ